MARESIQSGLGGTSSCPICRGPADCRHHIGWTDDGRTMEPRSPYPANAAPRTVLESDVMVNTGVSCRVYRDWVLG